MTTFARKGYGRIYVAKPENVEKVRTEIKNMSPFEFDYLPENLVVPFSEYPELCFTHKFDSLNLDLLTARCWKKGIYIFCLDNGRNDVVDENKETFF